MVENVDLIKGIFSHFNLDMRTHCKYSPPPAEDHEELEELPAEAPAEQVGEELEEPLEEIIENPKGRGPRSSAAADTERESCWTKPDASVFLRPYFSFWYGICSNRSHC